MNRCFISLVMVTLSWIPCPAQTTRLVPSQYATVQAAIAACVNGDQVLVSPGTYAGGFAFQGKLITVRSSGGAAVTTLAGPVGSAVVTFAGNEGPLSVLDGFTIRGGSGVVIQNSSPTIQNCWVTNNVQQASAPGGGIYCRAFGSSVASPHITGCTITNNLNLGSNNAAGGAGIAFDGTASSAVSSPVITNCVIASNVATGTLYPPGRGGGVAVWGKCNAAFSGCSINGNATSDVGGGCFIRSASASFTSCTILGNHGQYGGAFYLWDGSATLTGCIVARNLSDHTGGFLFSDTTTSAAQTITVKACTITANLGAQAGGSMELQLSAQPGTVPATTISNSIFWGSSFADIAVPGAVVSYSDVGLGAYTAGAGCFSADPRFADSASGDYHLASTSPCRDAGDPLASGLPAVDLDGAARIVGGRVDLGADELPIFAYPGTVDGLDLQALINGRGDPLASSRPAVAGDLLSVRVKLATPGLVGGLPICGARFYFTGNPFAVPGGGIWMDNQTIVFYGALTAPPFGFPGLPAAGLQFDFTVPPGLLGQTVRFQGLVSSANALNGIYATSNATEITF